MQLRGLVSILCFSLLCKAPAQSDSLSAADYKTQKVILGTASGALTVGSLVYLDQAWYQQYKSGGFHFFNDNAEWLQMDKAGHTYTTYQIGRLMMGAFRDAGFNRNQQLWIGGTSGLAYMTAIEVLDGFSKGWGFSWGDEVADVIGTALAISQHAGWKEQRVQIKFSYTGSGLARYNPELLGRNVYTQVLKDYNGQTYWLSINPSTFMSPASRFPKWLNVAFGYGAYGMLGATSNNRILIVDGSGQVLKFDRERRLYLSLDVDLTRIKTGSRFLKKLFSVVNILKIPAPTLQFSHKGLKGYALYF